MENIEIKAILCYICEILTYYYMATNREWAMKMIPVLIRWAQGAWDRPHYYSHLSRAVGHKTDQIGSVLGEIQDIIDNLKKKSGKDIPTLNGLVQNKKTGLPSNGLNYVKALKNYDVLSIDEKRELVRLRNLEAHKNDWNWVLDELGLEPARIIDFETLEETKVEMHGYGGEGKEHLALKNYIAKHPEKIGLNSVKSADTEHELKSGDKLDVLFVGRKNKHYAIEVKPTSASEGDVLRGIYQCVKYKAVMDAERILSLDNYDNEVLLVIAGKISDANRQIASDLGINYIDNFQ